ncbi:YopX family protein [Streptococcus pluranimalium]|uniref:YopX protein domain-containing protein n=1 Tax=Streptococcus pluranimalium TaxID=82348 RepID=A0A345VII6_9STRE|nr:YopX family protein [Streptococcus pluranimalium]AXJ12538.1 hypothetical protein Sp14A_06080 [Streptococcus pluranimalium]
MTVPKFRVWDTVKKAMNEVQAIVYTDKKVYPIYSKVVRRYVPFSEAVLMQSTGLKDKEGTEIFEGDLVEDEGGRRYVVKKNREFSAFFLYPCGNPEEFMAFYPGIILRVIGNIHENLHLLEGLSDGRQR